jgi:hypothetical protein
MAEHQVPRPESEVLAGIVERVTFRISENDFAVLRVTDIVLGAPDGRRLVIDTKFTSGGRFGSDGLKSGYLYQLNAYLRSQEGLDPCWEAASGLLLYLAVGASLKEAAVIQGRDHIRHH